MTPRSFREARAADRSQYNRDWCACRGIEIVEHPVAVIGPENDLGRQRAACIFLQQLAENADHVDIAVKMIALEETEPIHLALGGTQMREMDARPEALRHADKIIRPG